MLSPQYCPECFANTMKLRKSGIFEVVINSIPMDAGKILFNLEREESIVKEDLTKKVKSFFQYYSRFNHRKPIHSIKLSSRDFECKNNCTLAKYEFSIVNILFSPEEIMEILYTEADNHPLKIEITEKDIA